MRKVIIQHNNWPHILKIRAKILLVEDEVLISWSVVKALRKAGFSVEHAGTGEKALQKLESARFDLLLTDIKLPHIDGFHIATRAKSIIPSVPVIVITSMEEKIINSNAPPGTVDYYIEKPFDIDEVISIVIQFTKKSGKPAR